MWKRAISYIPQGSGGDKILGGWVRLFVPYNSSNKLIGGLDKDIPCMDLTRQEPQNNRNYYAWQDEMKQFYLGAGWGEMFSSFITTPAKLIDYDGCELSIDNSKRKNVFLTNSFGKRILNIKNTIDLKNIYYQCYKKFLFINIIYEYSNNRII